MIQAEHQPSRVGILLLVALVAAVAGCATPAAREGMFLTRTSPKPPADVHQAVRQYVAQKEWLYIGDNKLKNGEVTQVRFCDRKAAANIWKAGMHVAAMLPCGQLSIYQEGGMTKVTMLHPRYLTVLEPHAEVQHLVHAVSGPFVLMLDEVTR